LALKIEFFQNLATILKISAKLRFQNFGKKRKISEIIVYVISQLLFWGGREIAQEGGDILRNASPKLRLNLRQNFGKICEFKI